MRLNSFALVVCSLLLVTPVLAADAARGSGTMTLDGKKVTLVDAFAYTGEIISYDEDGRRQDHYVIVLSAEKIDQAFLAKSSEPVSDLNLWLYTEEPATLTIKLDPALKNELLQANLKGEFHSKTMTCYCDGAQVEMKLDNGRLRGRVHAPALKSRHDPADDPNAARSLAFDVKVDVPVVRIGG